MGRIQHTHSVESKYKAVQMYLENGMGYKRVAKELNIPEASIRRWVKYYKHEGMKAWRDWKKNAGNQKV